MFMCTKEASEKLQSMRFKLQLSREDQKTPILQLQEIVRWVGLGCVSGFCRTQHFSYLWSLLIELYLYMLICCFTHSWSGHFDCSFLTADGSDNIFMADSTNTNMHTFTLVTVCVCERVCTCPACHKQNIFEFFVFRERVQDLRKLERDFYVAKMNSEEER